MIIPLLTILLGFAVLSKSADEAVKRLVGIARHLRITEFAISFIIVGLVSVFPEMSIGLNSAFDGVPSLGLGVILGSNVADLTLVIGVVALMAGGIKLHHPIIKDAKWFLLAASLPLLLFLDGELSRFDGVILLAAFAIYLFRLLHHDSKTKKKHIRVDIHLFTEVAMTLISIAAIIISGMVITDAAEELSIGLSIPIFFIGTILAVGTCLPELIFAIKAANHHHSDLGFGNILGNVLADCMGVLGLIALVQPIRPEFPQLAFLSGGFMVLSMLLLILIFKFRGSLGKKEALAFIFLYIIFLGVQTFAENSLLAGAG